MKRILFLILFITGCASQVVPPTLPPPSESVLFRGISSPHYGPDILIAGMQDCKMIGQELDPGSTVGVLDEYKDPWPCVKSWIDLGKVSEVRVHLIDGTVNNHQCSSLETLANVTQKTKKWATRGAQYSNVHFDISPFLEWQCKNTNLLNQSFVEIRKDFPTATPVCNSLLHNCPSGVKIEGHGNIGNADFRSNDGASLFDADSVAYRHSGSDVVLGWTNCMNGRVSGESQVPPPPLQRKNWCTRAEVRQVVRIMRGPQTKPTINGCSDINAPQISKTNAEYYGVGSDDGRGNKGLLILKNKYSKISIRTLGGKEVGHFTYFGPYSGGGYRHYIGHTGSNQSPVQLMDQLGGEWGKVMTGNSCLMYNAIRRLGSFH